MPTICILTCSPRVNGNSDAAAHLLAQSLQKEGFQPDIVPLRDFTVRPCTSCGHCARHPGTCPLDRGDDAGALFDRLLYAERLFFTVPVYFYGPPAHFKAFIDRAQKFWNYPLSLQHETATQQSRSACAVFCAARTEGVRLFEANQLILRCFLRILGFRLEEPLLLRGLEHPGDLLQNAQYTTLIEEMGRSAGSFPRTT